MRSASYVSCGFFICAVSGCVPYFSVMERTAEMSGRVRDASSHRPLSGVAVELRDDPHLRSTLTAADGTFHLEASHNFSTYAMGGICGGGAMPFMATRTNALNFRLPGYHTFSADPSWENASRDGKKFIFKDILLKKESAATGSEAASRKHRHS